MGQKMRGVLLGDVAKCLVVISSDAASGHVGAHPEQAILFLGVDAQHAPPLPLVGVLQGTDQGSASARLPTVRVEAVKATADVSRDSPTRSSKRCQASSQGTAGLSIELGICSAALLLPTICLGTICPQAERLSGSAAQHSALDTASLQFIWHHLCWATY